MLIADSSATLRLFAFAMPAYAATLRLMLFAESPLFRFSPLFISLIAFVASIAGCCFLSMLLAAYAYYTAIFLLSYAAMRCHAMLITLIATSRYAMPCFLYSHYHITLSHVRYGIRLLADTMPISMFSYCHAVFYAVFSSLMPCRYAIFH